MTDQLKIALQMPSFQLFKVHLLDFGYTDEQLKNLWDLRLLNFKKKQCGTCYGNFHHTLVRKTDKGLQCLECAVKPLKTAKEKRVIDPFVSDSKEDREDKVLSDIVDVRSKLGLEIISIQDYSEPCQKIVNGLRDKHNVFFQKFEGDFSPAFPISALKQWFEQNYKSMPFRLDMFIQAIKEYCEKEEFTFFIENQKINIIPF